MMGGIIGSFNNTIGELDVVVEKKSANAILASADVNDETIVSVPILYYDQVMDPCVDMYDIKMEEVLDARQFEWRSCGYYNSKIETGLVEVELSSQYLPVAVGGGLLPNRGFAGEKFARWFSPVEGKSKSYAGTLSFIYNAKKTSFEYENEAFYPLDEVAPASNESINSDGHNHLFTVNLGIPFQVLSNGKEEFSITADDDTWVFLGNALVLDMGGIHEAVTGKFKINEEGEVYSAVDGEDFAFTGVKFERGNSTIVRIFHADRDSGESVFNVEFDNIVLNIMNTSLAKSDGGVEVAYDPADPSYIAPLGESLVVAPNKSKSLITAITAQVVALGAVGALIVMTISVAWRYSRRDRNQAE